MRSQRGNTLVLFTLFGTALFGFGALAIDVGLNTFTRTRIQSVADSAALAGGMSLTISEDLARTQALDFAQRNGYGLAAGDVTFPDSGTIKVSWTQPLGGLFARVLGIQQFQVPVEATVQLAPLGGLTGLRPWGIPMQDFLTYDQGTQYSLKMGSASDGYTGGGNFYPLGLDGTGGSEYRHDIIYGADTYYEVGDTVSTQTGNVVGPTDQGIDKLVGSDTHASYPDAILAGHYDCPRIVTVALLDPDSLQSGHDTVTIAGFATFFITSWGGNGDVTAQFITYAANGTGGGSGAPGGTQALVLVD